MTESTVFISEFLCSMDSFSKRQGICVVVHIELILSSDSVVNSTNTRVLLIEPWSLDVSLLLWVIMFWINFSNKVWDFLNALLVITSHLTTSKGRGSSIKVCNSFLWPLRTVLAEVIPVFSAPVSSIMIIAMANDNGSESSFSALDWSVYKGKFCDVVLIDHAKHGFDFLLVYTWTLDFLLVRGYQFSIAIIWDQAERLLFWLSVDWTKGCWNSTWWQTIQVGLFRPFLI